MVEDTFPGEGSSEFGSLSFTNEYGNSITIRYAKYHDDRREPIRFDIIGPNSISENNITLDEAKALRKILNVILA